VRIDRLVAVDDCGTVVNPLIVHGQISGGLAQGLGEALYERMEFSEDGQLMTGSLLEYAVPKASMLPDWELDLLATPSPNNPLGAKGVGESGCVAAPPAVVNAGARCAGTAGFRSADDEIGHATDVRESMGRYSVAGGRVMGSCAGLWARAPDGGSYASG
jgi:aerobic carbon-monoxide dehydrogenase large subunit